MRLLNTYTQNNVFVKKKDKCCSENKCFLNLATSSKFVFQIKIRNFFQHNDESRMS